MQHVDLHAAQRPRERGRKPQPIRIDIAPHRLDRGNGTELVEHGLGSHVTSVKYLVNTV
jgi:hypothetical protein